MTSNKHRVAEVALLALNSMVQVFAERVYLINQIANFVEYRSLFLLKKNSREFEIKLNHREDQK
jgi:hypothetical protein